MSIKIKELLDTIEVGQAQRLENITVFPLFMRDGSRLDYLTLKDVLEKKLISIKEVSAGGSVPELIVEVAADINVLILDGEELFGAKQNRILNASVMLGGRSHTVIPVSCTEQGRWSYTSASFSDADNIANYDIRAAKNMSVSNALKSTGRHRSDQGEVWRGIEDLRLKHKVMSRTSAMRDVYEAKKIDLSKYTSSFKLSKGQKGMLVFVNGIPAGLELISREDAFQKYFAKLLRSYCIDAMQDDKPVTNDIPAGKARDFIRGLIDCEESKYASVGRGQDYRYEREGLTGSALEVDEEVVHLAFLRVSRRGQRKARPDMIQ
jgi:hypothetical protein